MEDTPKKRPPSEMPEARARIREAKRAAGICLQCTEPAAPGKSLCQPHRERAKAYPCHDPVLVKKRQDAKRAAGICLQCKEPAVQGKRFCQLHLDKTRAKSKARYARVARAWFNARYRRAREEVIAAYGGACVCCGETTPEFLAIDHINGGGRKQRQTISGYAYLARIKKEGFPMQYQLLCHNCNHAKFFGICPHRR